MNVLASLVAFIQTPVGSALLMQIPTLVTDIVGIWHKNGTINANDVAAYLSTQQAFDVLCPPKPAPVTLPQPAVRV
jgi:hypothetical protein